MSDFVEKDLEEVEEIERRDKQIFLLVLLVLIAISVVLASIVIYPLGDLDQFYHRYLAVGVPSLVGGFLVLMALFSIYVIDRRKRLHGIRERAVLRRLERVSNDRRVKELMALVELTSLANLKRSFTEVLDEILNTGAKHFAANQAAVMLVKEGSSELEFKSTYGPYPTEALNSRIKIGEGVAGYVIQHGKPLLIHGKVNARRFTNVVKKRVNVISGMLAPIRVDDRVVGVISASRFAGRPRFDESDLQFLIFSGNLAAAAIEKGALYSKLKERHDPSRDPLVEKEEHYAKLRAPHLSKKDPSSKEQGAKAIRRAASE